MLTAANRPISHELTYYRHNCSEPRTACIIN